MSVAAKKEPPKATQSVEAVPQSFEEALSASLTKVQESLKKIPPEVLAKAQKEADQVLKGDLSWADLSQYTPDKLLKIAEMGFNQFQLGLFDSAERIFKGMTVVDPENFYYHQMLGATYQRKEKFPEAIVEYSVAVDLNSKDTVSFTNRGEVYMKLGIHDLANADFDQAASLDPKSEDKWANRARMLKEQIKLMRARKK